MDEKEMRELQEIMDRVWEELHAGLEEERERSQGGKGGDFAEAKYNPSLDGETRKTLEQKGQQRAARRALGGESGGSGAEPPE